MPNVCCLAALGTDPSSGFARLALADICRQAVSDDIVRRTRTLKHLS